MTKFQVLVLKALRELLWAAEASGYASHRTASNVRKEIDEAIGE